MKCSVLYCDNKYSWKNKKNNVTFFRFPRNDTLRNKWINAIDRCGWEPTSESRLCSLHFAPENMKIIGGRKTLEPSAIPLRPAAFIEVMNEPIDMDASQIVEKNDMSMKRSSTSDFEDNIDLTAPTSPRPPFPRISVASFANGCPSLSPPNSPRSDDSTEGSLLQQLALMTPDLICVKGVNSERGDIDNISVVDFEEEEDPLEISDHNTTRDFGGSSNLDSSAKRTKVLHDQLCTPKIVSVSCGTNTTFSPKRKVILTIQNSGTSQNSTPATLSAVPALSLIAQPSGTTVDLDSVSSSGMLQLRSVAQNVPVVGNPQQQLLSKPGTIPSYVISKKPVTPSPPTFAAIQPSTIQPAPVSIQPARSIPQPPKNVTSESHTFKQPTIIPRPKIATTTTTQPIVQKPPQMTNSNATQKTQDVIGFLTGHAINCKDLPIHPTKVQGCKTFVCEEVELPSHEKICFINVPLTDDGLRPLLRKAGLVQSKADQEELKKLREQLAKKDKKIKSLCQKVRRFEKKCNDLKNMLKEHPRELVEIDEMNFESIIEEIQDEDINDEEIVVVKILEEGNNDEKIDIVNEAAKKV